MNFIISKYYFKIPFEVESCRALNAQFETKIGEHPTILYANILCAHQNYGIIAFHEYGST